MSLANDIITHQLDPVLFDQNRCEFRIPPKVYLSNWRLGDLGCFITGGGSPGTEAKKESNTRYATHLGSYALIDRIRLLNNNVEIAELRNVKQYLAFNNLQRTNANAFNVNRTLNKSSFAFDIEGDGASFIPKMTLKKYIEPDTEITNSASTTPLSYLDLAQVIPFLKAQSYVTDELQNLRLIIEFIPQTDANFKKVFLGKSAVTGITIVQPTLLIDEVADPATANKLKNKPITYVNMDHEVVNVDAITSGTQKVNQRLRAFDDRTLRRMLIINEDPVNTDPSDYLGGFASYAMYNEQTQFSLNGIKMLPYDGVTDANQKLAMLNDVWGTHLQPQGSHLFDVKAKEFLYKTQNTDESTSGIESQNLVGQMSYGGYEINANVNELQLEYQRSYYGLAKNTITSISISNPAVVTSVDHGLSNGDIIVITGVTGTNADVLNGVSLVTKINADTFNLQGVDSSGKTFNAAAAVFMDENNYAKTARSGSKMNLLFWGEVVKTMSVTNNNVKIEYA